MQQSEIAIVGAGLGGVVAALLLQQGGYNVKLYEQAPAFARLGAGIQLGPNVLKIMRRIGLEDQIEAMGCKPDAWVSRAHDTGDIMADIPLNRRRDFYGASYVTVHRGDFQKILTEAVSSDVLEFDHKLVALSDMGTAVRMTFANGAVADADIVIGADGVNSMVREILLGKEQPLYTGYVGHRAIFPASRLERAGFDYDACCKWWSDDRHMMVYYLDDKQDEMYFVTGAPEPDWRYGTSFVDSSTAELRSVFKGYHPAVQALIDSTDSVTKWPLLTRPPLSFWSKGRIVMLGDACHPMKPHMAQGAAMAIEDAAVLVSALDRRGLRDHDGAFADYRRRRVERATRVQEVSNANTWLRTNENPEWVYAYDAFQTEVA